ncbi:MAG: TadE/TadG family type IV pilus assembly protein [Lacipirellulaceae bacterium]
MTLRSDRRRAADRHGVAATEFAVCLPVLVLILLGVIETCSMIFLKQALSVAAYEGGHVAVAPDGTPAQVRATCAAILSDRRVRGATIDVVPANLAAVAPGDYFEVRVSAPSGANAILPLSFFRGHTLRASAVLMKEL